VDHLSEVNKLPTQGKRPQDLTGRIWHNSFNQCCWN
jgi:hypothetical protein